MSMSARDALKVYMVELLKHLPLENEIFFAMAEKAGLFPLDTGDNIRAKATRAQKVAYFLNRVIEPVADIYLPRLLKVMKESEYYDVVKLSEEISAATRISEDKLKQEMIEAILEARDANHTILVRYGKVFFCGAGGTGKSNFLNLLMNDPFEPVHKSTDLSKPQQVTMKAQVSDEVEFERMDIDKEILLLTSYLPITTLNKDNVGVPSPGGVPIGKKIISTAGNEFALFNVVPNQKISPSPEKTWDILTFVDTGGQPQFINMLPVVNSFAMITFIVHDMSKGLDKPVKVIHKNEQGKDSYEPYEEKYTNLELIKTLISYASSIILPDYKFLDDLKEKIGNGSGDFKGKTFTLISLVGTHSDKILEEDVDKIDEKLREELKPSGASKKINIRLNENYRFLVPVDNEKQSEAHSTRDKCKKKQFTDPLKIRKHIYTQLQEQDKFHVPIHWLLLELEIRKKCNDKKFISYKDVLELSKENKLGDEGDVKKALRFHHLFGVLLYFEKVEGMKDLIITDHKWLFDKLTKIVVYSKKVVPDTDDECDDYEESGILTVAVLDRLKLDIDFGNAEINIKNPKEAFLGLLKYLRIVAIINKTNEKPERLFMPVLLKGRDLSCIHDKSPQANKKNGTIPLLIQFKSSDDINLFPRGVFCFLVVELINSTGSEPYEQAYNNFITLINEDMDVYITLIDRISVLEIQVAPVTEKVNLDAAVHGKIFDMINNSLVRFGEEFNISVELNYGFICKSQKCYDKEPHISRVKKRKENDTSYCIHKGATTLCTEHNAWLESFFKDTSEDVKNKVKQKCEESSDNNVDYHRLFWQELNKKLGHSESSIFVMARIPIRSYEYSIACGNQISAAQKTFQLVNHTISCATNYSPTGSWISVMWETLAKDKKTLQSLLDKYIRYVKTDDLKYYHVSLEPAEWYQWFDPSHLQTGQDKWEVVNVDSNDDDKEQADLYNELNGPVNKYRGLNKQRDVKISLKIRRVRINRPWLNLSELNNELFKIPGQAAGSWSTGELNSKNKGCFALYTTHMIVAKEMTVTASTKMDQEAVDDAFSLFDVDEKSYERNENSIKMKGTQIIGFVCTRIPKFPH